MTRAMWSWRNSYMALDSYWTDVRVQLLTKIFTNIRQKKIILLNDSKKAFLYLRTYFLIILRFKSGTEKNSQKRTQH